MLSQYICYVLRHSQITESTSGMVNVWYDMDLLQPRWIDDVFDHGTSGCCIIVCFFTMSIGSSGLISRAKAASI